MFHSRPVFHTCMGYFWFYKLLPRISAIKALLADFSLFQISYFTTCFLRLSSSYITTSLELSTFTRLGNLFPHPFQMAKHIIIFYSVGVFSCYSVSYILFLISTAEIIFSGLTYHIHLEILPSCLSCQL